MLRLFNILGLSFSIILSIVILMFGFFAIINNISDSIIGMILVILYIFPLYFIIWLTNKLLKIILPKKYKNFEL